MTTKILAGIALAAVMIPYAIGEAIRYFSYGAVSIASLFYLSPYSQLATDILKFLGV